MEERQDTISRQAALDALLQCRKHCIDPFDSYHIDIEDAEARIRRVPAAIDPKWIPCSERLPEDYNDVLVWFEYFGTEIITVYIRLMVSALISRDLTRG